MSITYTYEVLSVDEAARCMEIVYTAEGHQTMHIGARLPFAGELLEDIIKAYAPVRFWEEAAMQVVIPQAGTSGQIVPSPRTESPPPEQPISQGAQDL